MSDIVPSTQQLQKVHRKVDPEAMINKDRDLVTARIRPRMTLVKNRIFHAVLSLIRIDDSPFTSYKIDLRDIAKAADIAVHKAQEQAKEATADMVSHLIQFRPGGRIQLRQTPLFAQVDYVDGGYIEILISPGLMPALIGMKKQYDMLYPAGATMRFTCIHSYLMLDFLSQYIDAGDVRVELDVFRDELDIEEHKHQQVHHFRKKVIDEALDDIDKFTWLDATIALGKTGRKFTHVIINVKMKDGNPNPLKIRESDKPIEQLTLLGAVPTVEEVTACLIKHKFTSKAAQNLVSNYPSERIWYNIQYVEGMKNVGSYPAYITAAVRDNWAEVRRIVANDKELKKKEQRLISGELRRLANEAAATVTLNEDADGTPSEYDGLPVTEMLAKLRAKTK